MIFYFEQKSCLDFKEKANFCMYIKKSKCIFSESDGNVEKTSEKVKKLSRLKIFLDRKTVTENIKCKFNPEKHQITSLMC